MRSVVIGIGGGCEMANPFAQEEQHNVTILFGGLTWKHERLVQGVFNNLNYEARPLPNITSADLDAGEVLIDVGTCCPTIFTTGSVVNFLKNEGAVCARQKTIDGYVFLTAGASSPRRFGQYHEPYEMALDGMGLKDFRLFLLTQDQLDQAPEKGGGLEINMPLSLGIGWAILCGDMLTDMEYLTRLYEVVPGQTDKVMKESADYLFGVFQKRSIRGKKWGLLAWHFLSSYFVDALCVMKEKFDAIEVQRIRARIRIHRASAFERTCFLRILGPDIRKILEYIRKPLLHVLEKRLKKLRAPRARSNRAKFQTSVFIVRRYRTFASVLIWAEANFMSWQCLLLATCDAAFSMIVGSAISGPPKVCGEMRTQKPNRNRVGQEVLRRVRHKGASHDGTTDAAVV